MKFRPLDKILRSFIGFVLVISCFFGFAVNVSAQAADSEVKKGFEDCPGSLAELAAQGRCSTDRVRCYVNVINPKYKTNNKDYNVYVDYNCNGKNEPIELGRVDQLATNTPSEIEYFDPSDPERGLIAPGQRDLLAETESGNPVVDLIVTVATFLTWGIGIVSLVVIVIAAYYMLVAAGDDDMLAKGKETFKLALVGIVIVIFAYSIIRFVQSLLL